MIEKQCDTMILIRFKNDTAPRHDDNHDAFMVGAGENRPGVFGKWQERYYIPV